MSNQSELNNQGDYISGDVGEDGKDVVVGKNIRTRRKQSDQRNDQRVEVNVRDLGGRTPTVSDLYDIVAYDRLTGEPGLVGKVADLDKRLTKVEQVQVSMDNRLINIEGLITARNEDYRGKIHLSLSQLFWLILIIVLVVVVLAPYLQAHLPKGSIDGTIGSTLLFRRHS